MRTLLSLTLVLTFMVGNAWALARGLENGPPGLRITVGDQPATDETLGAEEVVRGVFSEIERRIIDRYFGKEATLDDQETKVFKGKGHYKGLPPGLAKRDSLPPGLARHVRLYGALPPGLQKKALPEELEALLPDRPDGEVRIIVDDDVLLIERATGFVLDILEDVLLGSPTGGFSEGS